MKNITPFRFVAVLNGAEDSDSITGGQSMGETEALQKKTDSVANAHDNERYII